MLNARTNLIGLFGNPVMHSLSPIFMNYVLDSLNLNYRYLAFHIQREAIKDALNAVKTLFMQGVNVTIPFKQEVLPFLDTVHEDAAQIGAVNCIVNKEERLIGYNTDYVAFLHSIEKSLPDFKGKTALLIGCGGAARAVVYALIKAGFQRILLINRTEKNAQAFCTWGADTLGFHAVEYIGNLRSLTNKILKDVTLVVNTTPLGMTPHEDEMPLSKSVHFNPRHVVYDLIYNPWETALLHKAQGEGAQIQNGFAMLIDQGLASLVMWFPEQREKIMALYNDVFSYMVHYYNRPS